MTHIDDLEERLRNHLNWTRWILISIPFVVAIGLFIYWIRDFLIQYGLTIYCVILAGLGFFYAWVWLLDNLTIKEEEENHVVEG